VSRDCSGATSPRKGTVKTMTNGADIRQEPLPRRQPTLTDLAVAADDGALDFNPLQRLAAIHMLTSAADTLLRETAAVARSEGASWPAIGKALGISRQAAQKRFGRREEADDAGKSDAGDEEAPDDATRRIAATSAPRSARPSRPGASWEVRTPRGKVLLRLVRPVPPTKTEDRAEPLAPRRQLSKARRGLRRR
jgi:hypothetical protein